ncbi:phage tail tape measure protein, partial [Pseudomonas aeruginosa]|uniref:phage tail tape measure protein n=2 Tax=Pseudomonas TaxID=286 RepID=UPI0028839F54
GVLERIKKLTPDEQTEVSTRIFGKEFGKDAGKLVNNLEELRRQLKLVDDAAAAGSMQREMDVRAEAIAGRWQVVQNKLFNT